MYRPRRSRKHRCNRIDMRRLLFDPRSVVPGESRGEDLIALGVQDDDEIRCILGRILCQHSNRRHRQNLHTRRQRHRLRQGDANAQARERPGTNRDVELLDVTRRPVLRSGQTIDDRKNLRCVLQAVLKGFFGHDLRGIDHGDGADPAGGFQSERSHQAHTFGAISRRYSHE